MPTLIQKNNEKVTVTKLKKIYSILQQSYLYAVQEHGTPNEWGFGYREDDMVTEDDPDKVANNSVIIRQKLFSHVKNLKTCDSSSKRRECGLASKYYTALGTEDEVLNGASSAFSILDGTSMMILVTDSSCASHRGTGKYLSTDCAWIDVDINGSNPPNTWGQDLFGFYLTKNGIIPAGTPDEKGEQISHSFEEPTGFGRAAWVIFNENMDYLRCPDDLSWDGRHKCK